MTSTDKRKEFGMQSKMYKYQQNAPVTKRASGYTSERSRHSSNSKEPRFGVSGYQSAGARKVKQMHGYQQAAQTKRPHVIAKNKLLKTVNIDLDAMIKESDKEYQNNNTFDDNVTNTMSENIPEPQSDIPNE